MMRTKTCPTCGEYFSYAVSRGADRKHCTAKCRETNKAGSHALRLGALPSCRLEGCNKKAVRRQAGLCDMHYCRQRRSGSFDGRALKERYKTGAGYIKVVRRGHELADADGRVFEHRLVMFDNLNGQCSSCFWCGKELAWGQAVIDHLDESKRNNSINNLVISCNNCNRARGALIPFIERMRPEALGTFIDRVAEHHRSVN